VGLNVGALVGDFVGVLVGAFVGDFVGCFVGGNVILAAREQMKTIDSQGKVRIAFLSTVWGFR
jgi:hypothetical protein